jgi:hypothetical protein
MIDIAVAYNRYRFLGNEFLTWIWFEIETDPATIQTCDDDAVELFVGNRMVFENRSGSGVETITIKGDTAGLEEGRLALQKGAAVIDMNLIYKSGSLQWQFSIKGESLNFSGLKLPETGAAENSEDMEGLVLDKLYLYEKPFLFLDRLYRRFVQLRLSDQWSLKQSEIRKWVKSG